ncbi:MAG: hypothetical protein Q8L72_08405 [Moraxellaceae bacterium]|nr:hypothetical protein [Moraxellaceae bacterium]
MKIKNAEKDIRHLPNFSLISQQMIEIHTLYGELQGRLRTISHKDQQELAEQAKTDAIWAITRLSQRYVNVCRSNWTKINDKWVNEHLSAEYKPSVPTHSHPVLAAAFAHIRAWQHIEEIHLCVATACISAERCLHPWAGQDCRLLYISEMLHQNDGYYSFWRNRFRHGIYADYEDDDYGEQAEPPVAEWLYWFTGCVLKALQIAINRLAPVEAIQATWRKLNGNALNKRQVDAIKQLLTDGTDSLSSADCAEKWRCSTDTTCNDLKALIKLGVLKKLPDRAGRSTRYALADPIPTRWSPAAYLRRRRPHGKYH